MHHPTHIISTKVETLGISLNSSMIKFLFSRSGFTEIIAFLKRLELARIYITNSFSSSLPPYSLNSKNLSCDDKHPGIEFGWFHESGIPSGVKA